MPAYGSTVAPKPSSISSSVGLFHSHRAPTPRFALPKTCSHGPQLDPGAAAASGPGAPPTRSLDPGDHPPPSASAGERAPPGANVTTTAAPLARKRASCKVGGSARGRTNTFDADSARTDPGDPRMRSSASTTGSPAAKVASAPSCATSVVMLARQ